MATLVPDWVATTDEMRSNLRAWALERGLDYEPTGLLPPISDFTAAGFGEGWHVAAVQHGRGAWTTYDRAKHRPGRFSENLCVGTLPGGLEGTVCHHAFLYSRSNVDGARVWAAVGDTVVAARLPEGVRLTRGVAGKPVKTRPKAITVTGPEYGANDKEPDLTPTLRDRIWWEIDADEDEGPLAPVFDRVLVTALEAAPELTRYSLRDGWLTVEHPEYQDDSELLDTLCRVASSLAVAVRRAAALEPLLGPDGGPLPEPPDTPYRRWLTEGVARVQWRTRPPPDVRTAVQRYQTDTSGDRRPARRGLRAFGAVLLVFLVPGVVGALLFAPPGATEGLVWLVSCAVLGVVIGALAARSVRVRDIHDRAEAFGREAFALEYAKARGLRIEDAEQVRRRIAIPLPGRPERSMYGRLAGAVDGRLVHWRDRTDPESANRALDLALIAAPPGELPEPRGRYEVMRAGGWLVVAADLGTGARTVAGHDALCAEAARLAAS